MANKSLVKPIDSSFGLNNRTKPNGHPNLPEAIDANVAIERVLGCGGEGTVYLAHDCLTGQKLIVKQFHIPLQRTASHGVRRYAETVVENNCGLPVIALIEIQGEVVGVKYPYAHLHNVHWRLFDHIAEIGQAMLGDFCRMQHYLISRGSIALTDPALCNFMMAEDGLFHFVDFGYGIRPITHPNFLDHGRFGYGFALLLSDIFHKNLKNVVMPSAGYAYDQPCCYCACAGFDAIAEKHAWVKPILAEVRSHNASVFLDAEFYKSLAEHLPERAHHPWWVIHSSDSLYSAGSIHDRVKARK